MSSTSIRRRATRFVQIKCKYTQSLSLVYRLEDVPTAAWRRVGRYYNITICIYLRTK